MAPPKARPTKARIAFIGLGNMGAPMAANQLKAGHQVVGYDLNAAALAALAASGCTAAASAAEAATGAEIIITMLPAGEHVREVWLKRPCAAFFRSTQWLGCESTDLNPENGEKHTWIATSYILVAFRWTQTFCRSTGTP